MLNPDFNTLDTMIHKAELTEKQKRLYLDILGSLKRSLQFIDEGSKLGKIDAIDELNDGVGYIELLIVNLKKGGS